MAIIGTTYEIDIRFNADDGEEDMWLTKWSEFTEPMEAEDFIQTLNSKQAFGGRYMADKVQTRVVENTRKVVSS